MNTLIREILFILGLAVIAYGYDYYSLLEQPPQSIHKWRQADCASLAKNYYQHGMNFFHPTTHNYTSNNGSSNEVAPSEIPILYYGVAMLYKMFGPSDFVYRLFNTLLFFLGLLYLFRLAKWKTNSTFWAFTLSIIVFSSPILAYYGNNFLSNTGALAFSFMGWYYFLRYEEESTGKNFFFTLLAFFLAASFKITGLFSVLAIFGWMMWRRITKQKDGKEARVWNNLAIGFIFIILIVGAWVGYAQSYNAKHLTTYFSTTTFPIWSLSIPEIKEIGKALLYTWGPQYFHPSFWLILAITGLFVLRNLGRLPSSLRIPLILMAPGILLFMALQFWTFRDHDYYLIGTFIFPVLLLIGALEILAKRRSRFLKSKFIRLSFFLYAIFLVMNATHVLSDRYNGWTNTSIADEPLYTLEASLRAHGISENDLVISVPDASHASLYFMNQPGWTQYTDAHFNRRPFTYYNQSEDGINESIKRGAKYLVINNVKEFYLQRFLAPFLSHLVFEQNGVFVFDLVNTSPNFTLPNRDTLQHIYNNVRELDTLPYISSAPAFYRMTPPLSDSMRVDTFALYVGGEYAYGFTEQIDSVSAGDQIVLRVWRKGEGTLVISNEELEIYESSPTVIRRDSLGWEQIEVTAFFPKTVTSETKCYVYHPGEKVMQFDDFQLIHIGTK